VLSATFLTVVALNIPVARQVIGFVYLTFIPGFIILKILRIENLDTMETVSISLGLSIAFLMVMGLFTNELGRLTGVSQPLSLVILMTAVILATVLLFPFAYVRDGDFKPFTGKDIKLNPLILVAFSIPLLGILGAFLSSAIPSYNLLLLMMILVISILMILTVSKRIVPTNLYPFILMLIAVGLLFHSSLITGHLNGFDIQHEYRFMEATVSSACWVPTIYDRFQSLLSVTVLPTIYWEILNIDGVWILKIVYPFIFAFVPVVLYKLWRIRVNERRAILSVFFFMANSVFFTEMLTLGRQMIAELFYVLLFFTLFNKKMNKINRLICFALFSFALVSSHYAVSYIFGFIVFLTWLIIFLLKKNVDSGNRHVRIGLVMLFLSILFLWYIYVASSATFDELLRMGDFVYRSTLTEFFNPESRGSTVLAGIGVNTPPTPLHLVGRAFVYATEAFIVIGFIAQVINRKKRIFEHEYLVVLSLNMTLLAMAIILPRFAGNLGMERLYHTVLLSAAPLCILGADALFVFVSKSKNKTLASGVALVVLVPYFLFQTGFVYEIAGVQSWSIPLSKYRFDMSQYIGQGLIEDRDIFGVGWLSIHDSNGTARIFSDGITDSVLVRGGYGMFPLSRTEAIVSNTTRIEGNGIVYLRWANIVYGTMGTEFKGNVTEYFESTISDFSKIYSNGGCEMYKNSP
jgi:uncharacterized membrane protein